VRLLRVAAAALALASVAGCSDDANGSGSTTATTEAGLPRLGATLPSQAGVVEDLVVVGSDGISSVDGTVLMTFTDDERACIDGRTADTPGLADVDLATPGSLDDPDLEQQLAEIVVGCVEIARIGPVVVEELVPQLALEGVDRTCVEGEVLTLQDTPQELAAVLAGDPAGLATIAGVVEENCRS
jgi:hypothetical protein